MRRCGRRCGTCTTASSRTLRHGWRQSDWTYLRDQILERVVGAPVTAIRPKAPYGLEYDVTIAIDGRNGETHQVTVGWLVPEDGPPRLLSAYVPRRRRG